MVSRIFNTIILLGFLGLAAYAGWKFFFENRGPQHEPLKAVPRNAVAFLTGENLLEFYRETDNTSLLWQEIKATGHINKFDHQLDLWNIIDKKGLLNSVEQIPFVLSFHPGENKKVDYLISISFPNKTPETINGWIKDANIEIQDQGEGIKRLKSASGIAWYCYNFENLIVFSPSQELIESSKRECESDNIEPKFTSFTRLKKSIGDHVKSSFFVRNSEYINLLAPHFRDELSSMFTEYNTGVAGLYDIVIEPNALLMRGFNWAPDSVHSKLSLLEGQQPVKPDLLKQLPGNTFFFYYLGMSDFEKFTNRLHQDPEMHKEIEEFNSNYNVNLKQHLLSWIEGELVYFNTSAYPDERLLLIKADDAKSPMKEIDFLTNRIDSSSTDNLSFNGQLIKRLNESNLFGILLGDVFNKIDKPYYFMLDNSIIFSTSPDALIDYLNEISKDQFLVRDVQFYDNLENHFSTATNVLFHIGFDEKNGSWDLLDSVKSELTRDVSFMKNIASFTYSLSVRNKEMFYSQALLKYKGSTSTSTSTIWDVTFDTLLQNTPHIVDNHITGTKNIVIQDRSNTLHSLSATGKTEFSVKIGEKIIGDIINVDLMRNGKNQLLFVTENKLHIIDLKGNYLKGFPATLSQKATSSPAAYDYESDGNFRILIPSGKKILNYNKEGNPVTGFQFKGLPADITQPPVFARIDNKDYLFICDIEGNVKLTDRKGNDRYELKFRLNNRTSNPVHFEKGATVETSKIIYCTNNGTIYKHYMNGTKDSLPTRTQVRNGYAFLDLEDDGNNELVVVDSSKIRWYDFKGNLVKEVVPFCNDFQLQAYKTEHGQAIIGGTCRNDEIITAFDNSGNDVARIKLTADSPYRVADINNDNKFEIIYCYKRKIFVYTLR